MWTILLLALVSIATAQQFLAVENGELRLHGEKVFLSGMNQAWFEFGFDFGNGRYECCTGNVLEQYLRDIASVGGNSVRIWLHCGAEFTPQFDGLGMVTGPDASGTFTNDLARYLDVAAENNILVTLVLWNAAIPMTDPMRGLLWDEPKLQSYIDNALIPMAQQLSDKVALAAWEIMNEPEGSLSIFPDPDQPCFDTTPLAGSGAGWAEEFIPMFNFLRFINRQIGAIKRADPKVLATVGSWSERSQTDNFGWRDYYKDECLIAAGGDPDGTIDFYQMHTYAHDDSFCTVSPCYSPEAPIWLNNAAYDLNRGKPNVLGEFSQDGSDGRDITDIFEWAYTQGYSGAWSWQANGEGFHSDDFETQARGTRHLQGRNEEGGKVDITL